MPIVSVYFVRFILYAKIEKLYLDIVRNCKSEWVRVSDIVYKTVFG